MKVIVFPTWKCGLSCPYCRYELQEDNRSVKYLGSNYIYMVGSEISSSDLISLLSKFDMSNTEFSFSGGEPLRYTRIVDVLNRLPNWSITSNTIHFTDEINLDNCKWWTASFHPHISDEAKDKFILNLSKIRSKVRNVSVTLVVKPDTIRQVMVWANRFSSMGYKVNVHPYYDDPEFSWYDHGKELKTLKKSRFICYGDRLLKFSGVDGSKNCHAGDDYVVIGPDGKMFRCLTSMLFGWDGLSIDEVLSGNTFNCESKCFFPCDWSFGIRGLR